MAGPTDFNTKTPETKVIAAAAGAGIGGAFGQFLLWLMGVVVWGVDSTAELSNAAVAAVPPPVAVLVVSVISIAGASLAGYKAPHTFRTPPIVPPLLVPMTPLTAIDTDDRPILYSLIPTDSQEPFSRPTAVPDSPEPGA